MQPCMAEFLGTLILVLMGNGVVANVTLPGTKGHSGGWIVVTMGWGMTVFVAVWCVGPISGAHINPAVTVGLAAADEFPWSDVPSYLAAQMIGALVGAVLAFVFYRDHFAACNDSDAKLSTFCTGPAIRRPSSNLLSEVIATAVLVLAVLLVAEPAIELESAVETPQQMKIGLGTLGALPVGLLVFSIGLSLGGTTGFAINPARDLAPRIAHALLPVPHKRDSDWAYAWIPVVGPILGGLLAAVIFHCS